MDLLLIVCVVTMVAMFLLFCSMARKEGVGSPPFIFAWLIGISLLSLGFLWAFFTLAPNLEWWWQVPVILLALSVIWYSVYVALRLLLKQRKPTGG